MLLFQLNKVHVFIKTGMFVFFFMVMFTPLLKAMEVEKGVHFIVQYSSKNDYAWAQKVLRRAEYFYDKISRQIGHSKYDEFWTWDQRVKIIIYRNKEEFHSKFNVPPWSVGGAIRDKRVFQSRAIIGYKQEKEFEESILPHEITHLLLHDFLGNIKKIPIWFDEGMAQYQEQGKADHARSIMKNFVKSKQYIPLRELLHHDIRLEMDQRKASFFYIQSITVIDFLIQKYGRRKFVYLCKKMKEGLSFEEALKVSYINVFPTVSDLEKKWLSYMKFS